ncbi:MAG: hypothetical protein EXS05_11195 [Planctomycetaceae bacterium]|nr:hypothetical protein [Planctomycetaceae bacterium]
MTRLFTLILAAVAVSSGAVAVACPICGQPTVTLSERLARSDVALLVEWVSGRMGSEGKAESTTYEIVEIHARGGQKYKKGERLSLEQFHSGKPGNLVLLLGRKTESAAIMWDEEMPLDVSETSFQYIIQAPSPETPTARRLEYFVRFLEYPDVTIANDAFSEFVNASAADIFAVASKLPRAKLKRWLLDQKLPPGRQAGFGLMLGLCGEKDDAQLLEKRILDKSGERRFGIEGLIVGYLLLTGDEGLDLLERTTLRDAQSEPGEVFPVQTALKYLWSYGNGRISNERLKAALRLLLENPQFTENVVKDLGRWKDWSIQPELMKMYGDPKFDDKPIRKSIVKFMIASTKDVPKDAGNDVPPHARQAAEYLDQLRKTDPKFVTETERFFYLE